MIDFLSVHVEAYSFLKFSNLSIVLLQYLYHCHYIFDINCWRYLLLYNYNYERIEESGNFFQFIKKNTNLVRFRLVLFSGAQKIGVFSARLNGHYLKT